ncbi:unnamed protein product [Vitrella brassicaformis CCMP3155]|uniref:RING-type domain-containing protein n=2 Tax=Vitrella brassicaformis TaxID=1169539 RepID=A0A0G4H3I1_VITBC|nr:unnamed protein product [Vitrella brassicaformis CCMP3155]|eukprot:CEM38026.1 unnamed protein product [Vitrella brassicaformis CCMP3155]
MAGGDDGQAEEQDHLTLKVKSVDGGRDDSFYKIRRTAPLARLMGAYEKQHGLNPASIRYLFDGEHIRSDSTPADMGMEHGDVIDAFDAVPWPARGEGEAPAAPGNKKRNNKRAKEGGGEGEGEMEAIVKDSRVEQVEPAQAAAAFKAATEKMRIQYVLSHIVEPPLTESNEDLAGEGRIPREMLEDFFSKILEAIVCTDEYAAKVMECVSYEVPPLDSGRPPIWKAEVPCGRQLVGKQLQPTLTSKSIHVEVERCPFVAHGEVPVYDKGAVKRALAALLMEQHDAVVEASDSLPACAEAQPSEPSTHDDGTGEEARRLREVNKQVMQKLQRACEENKVLKDQLAFSEKLFRDDQDETDRLARELTKRSNEITKHKNEIAKQEDRLKQSEKARKQLEAANRDKDKDIKSKEEHHRRQLHEERQRSETLRDSMGPLEAELISLRESDSGHVKEKTSLQETIAKLEASKQSLETKLTHLRSHQIDNLRALLTSSETEQELSHVVKTLKDKQAAMIDDELPQVHRLIREAESRLEAAHKRAMEQREADRQAAVELQLQQAAREARETIQKAREEGREDVLNCAICNDEEKRIMIRPCGHLCMCRGCYNDLMGKPLADRLCPVCRQNVGGHVNVFLQ